MKLLLDEMLSATIAAQLRDRGHDVIAVQDPGLGHLRGSADRAVLDHAARASRAVVTDNVPDFLACHRDMLATGHTHGGLLFYSNDGFPRHVTSCSSATCSRLWRTSCWDTRATT